MSTTHFNYQDHIIIDPHILAGKPVIKGTRIPVEVILERLAEDLDTKTLLTDYPHLTTDDVKACLLFFHTLLTTKAQRVTRRKDHREQALALAGAWADLPSEHMEEELDRIRHESIPTPPIDLDL